MSEIFRKVAHSAVEAVGTSGTIIIALAAIVAWVILDPYLHYSASRQKASIRARRFQI
jgi:hypothetical protein